MAAMGQGAKRKQDDFGLLAARTEQGISGSVNWPQFDELAPVRAVRSAARGSVPESCGPLLAGVPTLLPTLTPRNYHMTGPHELDVPYRYVGTQPGKDGRTRHGARPPCQGTKAPCQGC